MPARGAGAAAGSWHVMGHSHGGQAVYVCCLGGLAVVRCVCGGAQPKGWCGGGDAVEASVGVGWGPRVLHAGACCGMCIVLWHAMAGRAMA